MSKRTLLLITESTLGRFDLSSGTIPQVTQSWVRPSFASQSAGTLVDAALRLGKSRNRQVTVITTRCWTGPVTIGSDLIASSTGDDLKQIVALEAETYSGISAFESSTSIVQLPPDALGDPQFWLTQIQDHDFKSIEDALRQAGAKLTGIAHPAVPVINEVSSPTEQWSTLQTWDESTLLMRGNGEAIADLHSMSSGIQSQRTVQEFENFFQGVDNDLSLQWIGAEELPKTLAKLPRCQDHHRTDISSESDLHRWATAWSRSQTKQSGTTPLIAVPKRPMSKEVGIAIAAILGLLMMALCYGHYLYTSHELADIDASIEVMAGRQEDLQEDESRLVKLNQELDVARLKNIEISNDIEKSKQDLQRAKKIIVQKNNRWLSLVSSLIEVYDPNGWISEIRSTENTVSIHGLATNDTIVHHIAAQLESAPLAESWKILPASTKFDSESPLIDFTINLTARDGN
ncbi:MAG: hypothetical protein AAF939_19070 [Planctomycetota bacterium]